jgi:hypothetical protein
MRNRKVNTDNNRYRVNRDGTYYQIDNRGVELLKQAATPVATDVNAHAAALVSQLEKMEKSDKKMKM